MIQVQQCIMLNMKNYLLHKVFLIFQLMYLIYTMYFLLHHMSGNQH